MYIYMQINIWELIKPLNAGKFWQSKSIRADLGTKDEKNMSFIGKDVGEGEQQPVSKGWSCVIQQAVLHVKGKPSCQVRQLA